MPAVHRFQFPFDLTAELDFDFDWTPWCAGVNDSIVSAEVEVDTGLELIRFEIVQNHVIVWVKLDPDAPAQIGSMPQVHCRITTNSAPTPRKDRRSAELSIIPR